MLFERGGDGFHSLDVADSIVSRTVDGRTGPVDGAEVAVSAPDSPTVIRRTVRSDLLTWESRASRVGAGSGERVDPTVTWPDGTERTHGDVPANQRPHHEGGVGDGRQLRRTERGRLNTPPGAAGRRPRGFMTHRVNAHER